MPADCRKGTFSIHTIGQLFVKSWAYIGITLNGLGQAILITVLFTEGVFRKECSADRPVMMWSVGGQQRRCQAAKC
jgi:hypothetical protein